jgi:homocysteine S-methyltransferase
MAMYARRFIAAGARLVGGCCGTTPDHIRQIQAAVRAAAPVAGRAVHAAVTSTPAPPMPPVAPREKSALGRALADRRFVVIAELAAPRGLDAGEVIARAGRWSALGVTAINVPDYPRSGARISALALSLLLERQGHVETLLHYTCRDRVLGAMQSELIGAHAMGLRNVLIVTGDRTGLATYPDATAVLDVDSIGVANLVTRLNCGLDIAAQPIGAQTRFHMGVAVNPFAADPEAEWRRLDHKVRAGAEFVVTTPILDLAAFDRVWERLRACGLPIITGVIALESVRQAEFLASEAAVQVPDLVLDRLRAAPDAAAEGAAMTREMIAALRARVHGIQIGALHGSASAIERVLGEAR